MALYDTIFDYFATQGIHSSDLLPVGGAAILAALVYRAISRLYFHPLAHFPGPKLAALTGFYQTYYDLVKDGETVNQLEILHKRYGPVVRIGPNNLHFSDKRAFDAIYRDLRFPKHAWFYNAFSIPESSFGSSDISAAKHNAALVRPFFSRKSVLALESVIQDVVDRFLTVLTPSKTNSKTNASQTQIPFDLHRAYSSITMEVITTYCFAQRFDTVEYPNFAYPALVGFHEGLSTVTLMRHFPFLQPILFNLPSWFTKRVAPGPYGRVVFIKALDDQIKQVLKDPTSLDGAEHEIVYHHLLNPKAGPKLTPVALRHHAMSLVVGGTETVANTCVVATYNILANPNIRDRLRRELGEAWPEVDSSMPLERLEKLPYLTAVIKEALRLSHGVIYPAPRIATEATEIGGVIVPKDTVISMGHTFVHLNEESFPDPTNFDPERWFGENTKELENDLVPFSKGPRACLGINLAWAELYLILGNVFRKVELELVDTTEKDMEYRAFFTPRFCGTPQARALSVQGTR
ncbi:cytochrome P450 [Ephemerocybe angulata]|uniref:Cytochrome P450 n=1 Tax=Ephemerocybe angulata TaxID=980116 RepID=A0A8H6I6P5_9AGAR|nr:cytochrome P450 [Tulosesus angulatus]